MKIVIHPHARERMFERGATEKEVLETVLSGEWFPAKHGRRGFRRNFEFSAWWQTQFYNTKQVEVYATKEKSSWLVITVIVKYF